MYPDFFASGTGPMVEVFDDRLEISNPRHLPKPRS